MSLQTTLASPMTLEGIGLHTGLTSRIRIKPAKPDSGIQFKRMDVAGKTGLIPARYDLVSETRLGTTLTNAHGVSVSTIEHLMATFYGLGVDNALVEVHAPELPIMDGSSHAFVEAITAAGLTKQDAYRKVWKITRSVGVSEGLSTASAAPNESGVRELGLHITIEYPHPAIPRHSRFYDFSRVSFADQLSEARTFCFAHEVDAMRSAGLARGGSLENAVVVGEAGVINPEGLRSADEFIRHKALDCVGDYFLAGHRLFGHIETTRPGHGINNKLLRALFAQGALTLVSTQAQPAYVPAETGLRAFA